MNRAAAVAVLLLALPVHAADLALEGKAARLTGPYTPALPDRLEALPPAVETLVLDGLGGDVIAAMQGALIVRDRSLATRATGRCESACTILLQAGTERIVGPNVRLVYHPARAEGATDPTAPDLVAVMAELNAALAALYRGLGLDPGFVARVFANPDTDFVVDCHAALALGAATGTTLPGDACASPAR